MTDAMLKEHQSRSYLSILGPGILFAGAAIGTSHLVQSTRAGAVYGLGLFIFVLLANLLKYPSFKFGPHYAAVTGRSLIEAYRTQGRLYVVLIALSQFAVHSIIIAATAITTAGVALAVTGVTMDAKILATIFLFLSSLVIFFGGMRTLDFLAKIFVFVITIATFVAAALALPQIDWSVSQFALPKIDFQTFAFIIALTGLMPSGMDLSILHSLWSVEKSRSSGIAPNLKDVMLDFNVGYIGSFILAICFLVMGAGVLHSEAIPPASGAVPFAAQVIELYTTNLGNWSGAIVGVAAFGVMFTTLITILDGMPRVHAAALITLKSSDGRVGKSLDKTPLLFGFTALLAVGATLILFFFMKSFKGFIDFVTITAFIVGPFIALLNHIAVNSADVPEDARPSRFLNMWSLIGILTLFGFSAAYLFIFFAR